jgi:hypothetical protein
MQKIKLFEEFILETSSKKLEDINNHIKKMFNEVESYSITWMLYYILAANANNENSMKQLSKKHDGYMPNIISDDELTFDMEKAIDNYKKLKDFNEGRIKTGSKYNFNSFIEETDYEKKTLNAIENILDYYKKNKDVKSVNFHEFVKYIHKMFRVLDKTDKNSKISIDNMLGVIIKNGIDVLNIEKELYKYEKEELWNKNISILYNISIKAGNLDGDERDNDSTIPVFYIIFWKSLSSPHIYISLFVKKKEYILGMGYTRGEAIVEFNKKGEQMLIGNKDNLKHLGNNIKGAIQKFGEYEFKKTLDNIFEIFAKNGADVKFSYFELKKNMKDYL